MIGERCDDFGETCMIARHDGELHAGRRRRMEDECRSPSRPFVRRHAEGTVGDESRP